jgi:hypothetical protein
MKNAFAIPVLWAMLAVGVAHADKSKDIVKADTREAFAPVAAEVLKEMNPDGRYAYVKPDEREKVEASLADMSKLFEQHESVEAMDKAAKVQLFNDQETVNSILTLRDRDRLICERGAPTGSRIVTTTCHTYGELQAAQQASRKFMDERLNTPCNAPSCTGN